MSFEDEGGYGGRGGRGGRGGGFGRGGGGGGGYGGPREMHKATCSDCGAECEVPFKPTEGRPVSWIGQLARSISCATTSKI